MGCFSAFPKEKKSIGKTNGPVAKEPSSAPATSSTTDTVSGDSGGNNKNKEKDGQGNEGETGHRSCTAGSCMLFSSTTWWFTWAHFELSHWASKNSGPALVEVKPPTWRIYILKDWYFLMGQRKTEENNSCVLDLTAQFCWVSTLSYADLKPNCCGSLVGMCGSHARSF